MLLKLCRILARSDIFFYLVLWLMLLLVAGTIAEQQQGLYYAQQSYFSVYFFNFLGFIPLPGTYTILTMVFISLLSKLIMDNWTIQKVGSLVTHISALLLLIGGFLTAHFSYEGYMDIPENSSINYISDYHQTELVIKDLKNKSQIVISQQQFVDKKLYLNHFQITAFCPHCELVNNKPVQSVKPKDNEQAHPILELKIAGKLNYLRIDNDRQYSIDNSDYNLEFRHQRTYLPFNIRLNKFNQELHPGTEIAKDYSSHVSVLAHGTDSKDRKNIVWNGVISMNKPLRYKGYTFYQSSFYTENNQYVTVLAAVYNVGQSFPYIASIILSLALLIHLFQRLPKLFRHKKISHE